ncbi:cytochrome c oxidase subunit I [Sporosarcina sp. CAU 1771]
MSSVAQKRSFGAALWDWMTTVDHKKIGILYLLGGGFFFILGGIEAMLIRIQLLHPNSDLIAAGVFNEIITMHGTTMIFLAAMPILIGFMNVVMPLQIGARDVAFPFLNSLGFWMFFFGGLFLNVSWLFGQVPDAGWTSYASLSIASEGHGVDFYAIGLQIAGGGTLIGGINFLVTIINMRAPGMTYMRMPLFTWTTFVASAMILFAFPPLTVGLFFLTFDRMFGGNFFDHTMGGNTIIWEHIFWIFGHPEVYILILPAFGIFSEIFAIFSRKRLFSYSAMVFSTVLIGFLGFMVWAHHMFTVGLGPTANAIFSVATMAIGIPTGVKIFNWLLTMWGGSIKVTTPMLYALGFIPTFVMGGVTGIMLGTAPLDYQLHDTYFVIAHFHYVIVGGTVFGIFAGVHLYWPKMFGTMLNEMLGKVTFWLFFIGFHLTFLIQHWLGFWGMPRRVFTYMDGQGWNAGNYISSVGALFMALGVIVLVYNIIVTSVKNVKVGNDPWGDGRTLEWAIESPPLYYNFAQTPLVRGLDTFWIEKMEGNKSGLTPAEPVQDIHMPNGSIIPLLMSLGMFIAGFGAMFHSETAWGLPVLILGILWVFVAMGVRSVQDDLGYYVTKEEILRDMKRKGGQN